jgi:hypothetical protein
VVSSTNGLELLLERGIVRNVDADIPWAVLNMGRADVKCVIDDCDLLFRLQISNTSDTATELNSDSSGQTNMV